MFNSWYVRASAVFLSFYCGVWVFNHFPIPFLGFFVMGAYPVWLMHTFLKTSKTKQTKESDK